MKINKYGNNIAKRYLWCSVSLSENIARAENIIKCRIQYNNFGLFQVQKLSKFLKCGFRGNF